MYLADLFTAGRDCDRADADPACTAPIPSDQFAGAVMIGNFAGPLVLTDDGTTAFTGSRDSGILNAVGVEPGGVLHCPPGTGNDATHDCRKGLNVDLLAAGVDGPFSIVPGTTFIPGTATPKPVFFISSVIPHIDSISGSLINTSTAVGVLDMQPPWPLLYSMRAGSSLLSVAGGSGVGPMVFDSIRRQLYLGGCYVRSAALGNGQPGSAPCSGVTTNYLRILNVDSANATDPIVLDLYADVLSITTVQLLLGDPDPVTQAPTTLWATMRAPDSLVRIELPTLPSVGLRVREIIPLPIAPADMVRIARPGAPDLLAVVAEKQNTVAIVDTATDEVVTLVRRLGDSPFIIKEVDCPIAGSACLVTSVFGACRIGLIEVPRSQPEQAKLRALAGSCP